MTAGRTVLETVSPDAPIIAAWEHRVSAYAKYNASSCSRTESAFWPLIDECDTIIQTATAKTPRGVEVQIWTALHNSSAYTIEEEAAILSMDVAYIEEHKKQFDWDVQPMIAAIRSLRSMAA